MEALLNPWLLYSLVVLAISGAIGMHLGRFRAAYTEMTGMMVGMTMGMLNGFLLGFAVAAATSSMFWGNLFGILLGLALGVYYGRAGGLMGMLDGGMGGVMGGSMGAMLQIMLFPNVYVLWTALLLSVLYVVGMGTLVVLIERSDHRHAALHRALPWLARAIRDESEHAPHAHTGSHLPDYYALLGLPRNARPELVSERYLEQLAHSEGAQSTDLERAYAILSDPRKRAAYDRSLGTHGTISAAQHPLPRRVARTGAQNAPEPKREAPVSWVGVAALGVAGAALAAWLLLGGARPAPTAARWEPRMGHSDTSQVDRTQIEAQAVAATLAPDGTQTLDFAVSGDTMGYTPNVIKLRKDVPARINISVKGSDPGCGRFVGFKGLGAHGIAEPGQTTLMEFTPTQAGVYEINCNMDMMQSGYLIVE
jgi:hypothetical protein